eukprot:TRINITY_DN6426_c0_g2_i1.p1 TRINITY_DN6426_c0_g2~~TRINITY_DN6426_c0_g2_i1.p1  ORF type:complete len:433 (+),score=86.61 TRINITY_DN6426_c0_g2_i1:201-1499(+)
MEAYPWRNSNLASLKDNDGGDIANVEIRFMDDYLPLSNRKHPATDQNIAWAEEDFQHVLNDSEDDLDSLTLEQDPKTSSNDDMGQRSPAVPSAYRWSEADSPPSTTYHTVQRPKFSPLEAARQIAAGQRESLVSSTSISDASHSSNASRLNNAIHSNELNQTDEHTTDDDEDHVHCKHRNLYRDRLEYRHRGRPIKPAKLSPRNWSRPRSRFDKEPIVKPVPQITKAIQFDTWAKQKDAAKLRQQQYDEQRQAQIERREREKEEDRRRQQQRGKEAFKLWLQHKQQQSSRTRDSTTGHEQESHHRQPAEGSEAIQAWIEAKAEQAREQRAQARARAQAHAEQESQRQAKAEQAFQQWLKKHNHRSSGGAGSVVQHPKPWTGPLDDADRTDAKDKRLTKSRQSRRTSKAAAVLSPPLLWAARLESERTKRPYR